MFLGDIPRRNAFRHPEQMALEDDDRTLTWLDLNRRINRLCAGLTRLGLRKGDRLGVLSIPSIEVVETYFAAAKLGLVIVPVHTGLVDSEVKFLLDDVEVAAVIADTDRAAAFGHVLTGLSNRIAVGGHDRFFPYEDLLEGMGEDEPEVRMDESDLFAIRFTSGTTGRPKGCPSTHRDWIQRSLNFLAHINHSHKDRALLLSPLSLGVGSSVLMTYSLVGASMVISPRFDASRVLKKIESAKITTFMVPVPTLFGRLLDDPAFDRTDLSSLRVVGYGGAVFPVELLVRTLERFPCRFFGVYGHLEAGGFSTYLMPDDHRIEGLSHSEREKRIEHMRSCGREALQADVRITDEDGLELPHGEVGEMVVRTEGMVADYWKRPGEIEKVLRDGWFRTGDAASIDSDGYVYISDRIKDVVRTGGMNVSSVEVESVLLAHAAVADAAVIGIPDPRWGESLTAVVVASCNPDAAIEESILAHCREQLANYKVPKKVKFIETLPKNSMGKVLKRELRLFYTGTEKVTST